MPACVAFFDAKKNLQQEVYFSDIDQILFTPDELDIELKLRPAVGFIPISFDLKYMYTYFFLW